MSSLTSPARANGTTPRSASTDLSLSRLYAMRAGYLLMGVGLAIVKWPSCRARTRCRCTRESRCAS